MVTTLKILAEQVLYVLNGGDTGVVSGVQIQDVQQAIIQSCNRQLKAEYWNNLQYGGELNAGNLMLATYPNIKVESKGKIATATLPLYPMKLPKNAGVFEVSAMDDPLGMHQFIPIPAGHIAMIGGFSITNDILGQVAYINEGLELIFTTNIAEIDEIAEIKVKMVVSAPDLSDEYAPLPLNADMEILVMQDVLTILGNRGPRDTVSDNVSDTLLTGKS